MSVYFQLQFSISINLLAQLHQLTASLSFVTKADALLEAVSYPALNSKLPSPELLRLLGEPTDAAVQVRQISCATIPARRAYSTALNWLPATKSYKRSWVHVYRLGSEPQLRAYALGWLPDAC